MTEANSDYVPGDLLRKALSGDTPPSTGNIWKACVWQPGGSRKINQGLPVLIASPKLVDPISNPEGVSVGFYHQLAKQFSVSWLKPDTGISHTSYISEEHVTHVADIKGPY